MEAMVEAMKIAVTGPRDPFPGTDKLVEAWVDSLPPEAHLFHGNAKGVDRIARDRARGRGLTVTAVDPAYRDFPPKLAPLVRNAEMLSNVDELMGFWHGVAAGGAINTLWLFHKLFRRRPQWTLIDPSVKSADADAAFNQICISPPSHWLQALNLWRQSTKPQTE